MAVRYFLDTYAIVEMVKGNQNYIKYLDLDCHTTIMNLYELYFILLKNFGKEFAEKHFKMLLPLKIELKDEYIPKACEFKLSLYKSNISYVDALGYIIALENGFKFLTGDVAFKNLANVEFVI